ncbi:uncharacterized protein LOC108093053 [Drosophila ficusphila]|uniref:uncharacterized protein LOC108093053 n=1 Tax=Drosophila ficusphila TaxID=30025 RepID=UPI0007E8992C|nr:uncharacterized protein LOC108093053 [Drosophila ficusphila]
MVSNIQMNAAAIFLICLAFSYGANIPSKPCPLEASCGKANASTAICGLDEEAGCILKYPSRCHLDIAACQAGKNLTDYNELYCSMESYFCEKSPTYARWTIFFGNEDV